MDITVFDAHISQKTVHTFRTLVSSNGKAREIFSGMTDRIIEVAGLNTERRNRPKSWVLKIRGTSRY